MKGKAAALCLGVWLMGTVCVSVVAMQDFYTIDRLLADPGNATFAEMVEQIGHNQSRNFLRYLASELNRLYFRLWNFVQFGIGGFAFWLVLGIPQASRVKWLIVGMLVTVALLTLWITPQILLVGRSLDFVPRDPVPPNMRIFGFLHAVYTILEILKFATGVLGVIWIFRLPCHIAKVDRP